VIGKRALYALVFSLVFIVVTIGNGHAQVRVLLVDTPNLIDSGKQNTLEVKGHISGADPDNIVIKATWHKNIIDFSQPLQKDERGQFKHAFSIGGNRCGVVRFEALVRVSNVTIASEPEYTYVDCDLPEILVDKPGDRQVIKPYAPVQIELKVRDDMLSDWKYLSSTIRSSSKYTLNVEVDGSSVQTNELYGQALQQLPVRKFSIPGLKPGQHAIRFSVTDPSGKGDEKTIFVNADGTPPLVRITSPGNNDRIGFGSGTVPALRLSAEVTDQAGIDRVVFYLDGKGVGVAETPSGGNIYTKKAGISEEGQKTVTVKAFDKMGNSSQSSVTVFVFFDGKPKAIGSVPSPSRTLPTQNTTLP